MWYLIFKTRFWNRKIYRKWAWGDAKLLKAFFWRLFLCFMRHSRFQLGQFFIHSFEIWQFYSYKTEVQNRDSVFWNLKFLSSYHDNTLPLSITKVLFRGFGCKIQTKRPIKKTLTRFWAMNRVKYENVIIGAIKRNTSDLELRKWKTKVGKYGARSLYLFEIAKQKLNSDLDNLISFSVIYRFIGLSHRITDMLHQPKTLLKMNSNLKTIGNTFLHK